MKRPCGMRKRDIGFSVSVPKGKARIGRAFLESPSDHEAHGMTNRISKNFSFSIPGCWTIQELEQATQGPTEAWNAIQEGAQAQMARARRARARAWARAVAFLRAPRHRTQPRVRARRSPASTRRATTDSGGDGDGSGDPEPPRPLYSLSPYAGGAL